MFYKPFTFHCKIGYAVLCVVAMTFFGVAKHLNQNSSQTPDFSPKSFIEIFLLP